MDQYYYIHVLLQNVAAVVKVNNDIEIPFDGILESYVATACSSGSADDLTAIGIQMIDSTRTEVQSSFVPIACLGSPSAIVPAFVNAPVKAGGKWEVRAVRLSGASTFERVDVCLKLRKA